MSSSEVHINFVGYKFCSIQVVLDTLESIFDLPAACELRTNRLWLTHMALFERLETTMIYRFVKAHSQREVRNLAKKHLS